MKSIPTQRILAEIRGHDLPIKQVRYVRMGRQVVWTALQRIGNERGPQVRRRWAGPRRQWGHRGRRGAWRAACSRDDRESKNNARDVHTSRRFHEHTWLTPRRSAAAVHNNCGQRAPRAGRFQSPRRRQQRLVRESAALNSPCSTTGHQRAQASRRRAEAPPVSPIRRRSSARSRRVMTAPLAIKAKLIGKPKCDTRDVNRKWVLPPGIRIISTASAMPRAKPTPT